jgi:hypothetical protein
VAPGVRSRTATEGDMGSINITVDHETAQFNFVWQGDRDELQHDIDLIAKTATDAGMNPDKFAESMVHALPSMGLVEKGAANQRMAIVYFVLKLVEQEVDLPIPIFDYVALKEITATLTVRDGEISATSKRRRRRRPSR